jgi:hypothetical protein
MPIIVDNNYSWATHQPLIKAVMDLYYPKLVLELGAGYHSTFIFRSYLTKLISIENDKEWVEYLNTEFDTKIIYHNLGTINPITVYDKLPESDKATLIEYYNAIEIPEFIPRLLFVDQFTCGRAISINEIGFRFDIIIYHDCEPASVPIYGYDKINLDGYNRYYLKSQASWSCLMVHGDTDKGIEPLHKAITPHLETFKNKYPELPYMALTETY